MDDNWLVKISNVYREANRSADYLANLACSLGPNLIVFDIPPNPMFRV